MFDQVVKVGNNGADDNEESIEQGDDEENEGEEEGENDNFGFDEPANGNQHLQLPPADADEQFPEEDHIMDVPDSNNIIDVSDEVMDEHIEVAQPEPLQSQRSQISNHSNKHFQ